MKAFKRFHLRLLTDDFKACFRFYRDVLELPVRYGSEDEVYAEFKSDAVHFALFRKDLMAQVTETTDKPAAAEARDDIAVILRVDDLDRVFDRLAAKGVEFHTLPTDRKEWGCRTAHFRDPDGRLLELNADLSPDPERGGGESR